MRIKVTNACSESTNRIIFFLFILSESTPAMGVAIIMGRKYKNDDNARKKGFPVSV
ncbi:unnamed protein product [marine sediment metagenome]|uniref:Uncharacterized protein n=1 Tax=marine sediment metagenome TaxID=412755 RepID=X1D7E8_9ZZZZ